MNYDTKTGTFYYWPWDKESDITSDKNSLVEGYANMLNQNCIPLITPRNMAEYLTCSEDYIRHDDCIYRVKGFPRIDIEYLDNVHVVKRTNEMLHDLYEMSNNPEKYYDTFTIKKRNDTLRTIFAPKRELKLTQNWIAKYILNGYPISENAKAYRKGFSIIDNAKYHLNRPVVVKADIRDFFGSIKLNNQRDSFVILGTREYRGYTLKHIVNLQRKILCVQDVFSDIYRDDVAALLANLCCRDGKLPQGAPTSPALSNIVFYPLDKRIDAYCRFNGITYSRYSDDMTFSGDFDPAPLLKTLRFILCDGGFVLNETKTKVLRRGQRQQITGIVVNKRLQAPKEYRKNIRQAVYYMKKYGVRDHILYLYTKNSEGYKRYVSGNRVYQMRYLQSILGKVNFVLSINPKDKEFFGYRRAIIKMKSQQKRSRNKNHEL